MGIIISVADLARMSRHCEEHYPQEGCGILIGRVEDETKRVWDVLLTENSHQEGMRSNRYTIPPEQLLQIS